MRAIVESHRAAMPNPHPNTYLWFRSPTFGKSRGSWAIAITLSLATGWLLTPAPATLAQLIPDTAPDRALGTTVVRLSPTIDGIRGGLHRGQNLFHSFQEFNIGENRGVYFDGPAGIQNILTRITGGNPSQLLGTLGTRRFLPNNQFAPSPANLFLINPAGIIFGSGARLDVGGSFVATTAHGLKFGNLGEFSATNPQPPSPLLTIHPSAYWFNQLPTGRIVNQSVTAGGAGLRVPNGQSLTLLGSDVSLEGGRLTARGGRVEMGTVAGAGQVEILPSGALSFPPDLPRGDVNLTDRAEVYVRLNNGGEIGITARNMWLTGRSLLLAGIDTAGGTGSNRAGDVRLDASGVISLEGASQIQNVVAPGIRGNAGNVHIVTNVLEVKGGSGLSAVTFGTGDAGNVEINARDRVLFQGSNTAAFSSVEAGGIGNGGNVEIITGNLEVHNGAQLVANTKGQGNAGNVRITARDLILFQGTSADGYGSGAFSSVGKDGIGQGGDVEIVTTSLEVRDGAQLSASTFGRGNAGNVRITARDRVLFQGRKADGQFGSGASSRVAVDGTGQGGNVEIVTSSLEVRDGAGLTASTFGQGNGGNVRISARDRVLFQNLSTVFSNMEKGGIGQGGNVEIVTSSLEVRDGAQLSAITEGQGNAGNIRITARDRVLFEGRGADGRFPSAAFSSVGKGGIGQGGNVEIVTGSLEVRDNAQLIAGTQGRGNAGNVVITAHDLVLFQNSSAFSSIAAGGVGQGGNVEIYTGRLEMHDGAALVAATRGTGDAGNVVIMARDTVLLDGTDPTDGHSSGIFTSNGTANANISSGRGGNVWITTSHLQVSNGAVIDARTVNNQPGGTINLNLDNLTVLSGGQIFTTSEGSGTAGTIAFNASGQVLISGIDPTYADRLSRNGSRVGPVSANSGLYVRATSTGAAGEIRVSTPNLTLTQQGRINAESASGNGGNIVLNIGELLLLRQGSQISTSAGMAQAGGNGGNITINAPRGFIVGVKRENSDITANAFTGNGGRINITAQGVYGLQFRPQLTEFSDITASSTFGLSGTVALNILGLDPTRSLFVLPATPLDPRMQMDERCKFGGRFSRSSFVYTGRGGFPSDPFDVLRHEESELQDSDWIVLDEQGRVVRNQESEGEKQGAGGRGQGEAHSRLPVSNYPLPLPSSPILEATGWIQTPDGQVYLVADAPNGGLPGPWLPMLDCVYRMGTRVRK